MAQQQAAADVPREFGKNLCACVRCHLVKAFDQFLEAGCENCAFFGMEGDRERTADCTTTHFQGLITVMQPSASWAAKWVHVSKFVAGAYALSTQSDPPQYVEDLCEDNGFTLRRET